jgi:sarcosine oxidase
MMVNRLSESSPKEMSKIRHDVVVIGGGVVGLAAAWHLLLLGCRPLAVVERFHIGHDHGSSHGSARMTRSTYASQAYAALMRHVRDQEWPRLERAAGVSLVDSRDVVFFGPDRATLAAYAAAVEAAGADVERLSPAEAKRRFPTLRIPDDAEILQDRTGGIIHAEETIRALHRLVVTGGAAVMEHTRVLEIERDDRTIRIVSDRGVLETDRVVIATGSWLPQLMPAARAALTVVPQTVAYVRLGVPAQSIPPLVHFAEGPAGVTYALGEVGRDVLKVGRHVTKGPGADPDASAAPSPDDISALRASLDRILAVPTREVLGSERCLYTMTPTEDFIIDRWPGDPRVAFACACSGHGFKFAPLTGRLLAELVVHGKVELPGGGDSTSLFALPGRRVSEPSAG